MYIITHARTDLSPGFGGAPTLRWTAPRRRRDPHAEAAHALAQLRGVELVGFATPQRGGRGRRLEASGSRIPGLKRYVCGKIKEELSFCDIPFYTANRILTYDQYSANNPLFFSLNYNLPANDLKIQPADNVPSAKTIFPEIYSVNLDDIYKTS